MTPRRRRPVRPGEADVVPAAALLADPARVAMLWALIDGRALPAGDLARAAGVTAPTASAHLARLMAAGWVAAEPHGRHRYMRLVQPDVAALLEALAVVGGAPHKGEASVVPPELHLARSCYDHLAGRAGVGLTESLLVDGSLRLEGKTFHVTPEGRSRLARLGIDVAAAEEEARTRGRYFARSCLDWSERRAHLAGQLGQALLEQVLALGWFERRRGSRALRLTGAGRRAVQREFGLRLL